MTSLRQLEANRLNALNSTGPRTENGKQQSRRNALKHGLTAETVIEPLENPEEYRAFEEAIVSEYLPQTPVERELVHRLASLFWRLRRATSIETGLLRMQGEILQAFRSCRQKVVQAGEGENSGNSVEYREGAPTALTDAPAAHVDGEIRPAGSPSRDIAVTFLRLANLDSELVDRLSRYEASLWRQLVQTLFALQTLKRR
jgi:hypothetical protein